MIIAIVEDEPKIQELLKAHFEGQGHQVIASDSGEGGIVLARQHQPAVMLLDMWLKGKIGGLGVLKETRTLSPSTKVVIVTGFDESSQEDLLKLGAAALLRKPIRLEELDALVAQLVRP